MILAATFVWLSCALASEPDDPAATAGETAAPDRTFGEELERAKGAYFEGRSADALEQFRRLELRLKSAGETPPWSEAIEAMTWLAEIQFIRGDVEGAEETFRWILERDVDTPMLSPYHHPIDVVSLFEEVRVDVSNERRSDATTDEPIVVVERQRVPAWTWLPFGIPQVAQRRPGAAITFGVLQVGFAATSVVTYFQLRDLNRDLAGQDPPPSNADVDALRPEYQRLRVANGASFGLFWGTFVWSRFDAGGAWRKDHPVPTLTFGPTPAGVPGVTFRGTL